MSIKSNKKTSGKISENSGTKKKIREQDSKSAIDRVREDLPEAAIPLHSKIPKISPVTPKIKNNISDKCVTTDSVMFPPPLPDAGVGGIVAPLDVKVAVAKPIKSNFNSEKIAQKSKLTAIKSDMSATVQGMKAPGVRVNFNNSVFDENQEKASEGSCVKYVDALELDMKRLTDDYTDQVESLLEVANYISNPDWTPESIVDILYVLVRTLNLDVMTLFIPSMNMEKVKDCIYSRGYKIPPTSDVVDLWNSTFSQSSGIEWRKVMELAQNTETDLAYWIVHSNINSVGYVPIRTHGIIFGFIFVGAYGKKIHSPITASILDLCGSRIGLEYKLKFL